ncbi:MAG: DUF1294 domain-containing protein [Clostridia bacterium]|nr:DUF1294 domain-containing protein [Clostridia bacterium]
MKLIFPLLLTFRRFFGRIEKKKQEKSVDVLDKTIFLVFSGILLLSSLADFILFGVDKGKAGREGVMRIKEKVLLGFCVFGGAIGAFLGRIVFRHKTKKSYFTFLIISSLILQVAVFLLLLAQVLV